MFMNVKPGDQVIVVPDWAMKTVSKKGKVEDLVNFSKMRQWFTQEQLVALDAFSGDGISILWSDQYPVQSDSYRRWARSLSYTWFFPEDAGQSKNGSDTDLYVRNQLTELSDNKQYSKKIVDALIVDYFKQDAANKVDLYQSYSVYSASNKLVVVALNQGILSNVISTRKVELRIMILRSILEKLQGYYDLNVVHKTSWFEWYLLELDLLK